MFPKNLTPGEHHFNIHGPVGNIEAILTIPEMPSTKFLAILGHPHSLQGGTMNNKVVTTMVRAFRDLSIPSIRFNFRGVGQTAGVYDHGIGESEDMLFLARETRKSFPEVKFIFGGFSFGSYVAYRAAAQLDNALLITIAPPVHHYSYEEFLPGPSHWIIIQGDADEVVPYELVVKFAADAESPIPLWLLPDTSHFFHGKLTLLKEGLIERITRALSER